MTDERTNKYQKPGELSAADEQLLRELTERARTGGLKLTGEGGLLGKLTKMVIEGALEKGLFHLKVELFAQRDGLDSKTDHAENRLPNDGVRQHAAKLALRRGTAAHKEGANLAPFPDLAHVRQPIQIFSNIAEHAPPRGRL